MLTVVNMELIGGMSCIRFFQNMGGLKMFISCVMKRSKAVVCFLPIWDIGWKPNCGVEHWVLRVGVCNFHKILEKSMKRLMH